MSNLYILKKVMMVTKNLKDLVLALAIEEAVMLLKQMRMAEGEELKKDLLTLFRIRFKY